MQNDELQALLLSVMPQWHYWIAKPFVKQVVTEEVSGGMFHCLQMLRANGEPMTMSEIARAVHCSKQQMTKTVGKLIDCGFAERVPDPADRRIIRLKLTSEGNAFIDRFQALSKECFAPIIARMTPEEQQEFCDALKTLHRIFTRLFHAENADHHQG